MTEANAKPDSCAQHLRELIASPGMLRVPGVYDTLSAVRAEAAGFVTAFVSGSALAAAHLGRPDIGLFTLSETAEIVARIADRVEMALFVDADQGFGNSFAVARSIRMLERAGASGIQIEDQQEVKPSSAPLSRPLVPLATMLDKIAAAQDARINQAMMISARTDAMATEGIEEALQRVAAFVAAGADAVFAEGVAEPADLARLLEAVGRSTPVLCNMAGPTGARNSAEDLECMGFSLALYPTVIVSAATEGIDQALADLARTGEAVVAAVDRIEAAPYLASAARRTI